MKKPHKQKVSKSNPGVDCSGDRSTKPHWQQANAGRGKGLGSQARGFRSQPRSVAKQYWRQ